MAELSCAMVQSFDKGLINKTISNTIMDLLLSHILRCKDCRKHFIAKAKDMGLTKFNIKQEAANFINTKKETDCPKTRAVFIEMYGEKMLENMKPTWTYYAETHDLSKTMNLKCVYDFTQEQFEVDDKNVKEIEAFVEFGRYITAKLCKDIDLLERCYNMEEIKR